LLALPGAISANFGMGKSTWRKISGLQSESGGESSKKFQVREYKKCQDFQM
jgi:hypothetical protein